MKKAKRGEKETKPGRAVPTLDESQDKFELELVWCLKNLENYLSVESCKSHGKGNTIHLVEANRVFNALRNPKTSFIKKRQLMNNYWGDYRSKMSEERSKFKLNPNKMKIKNYLEDGGEKKNVKAVVVKKRDQKGARDTASSSSSEFKFNFGSNQTPASA